MYVVLKEQTGVSVAQLRSYLAERFPITVASVSFTVLDRIPLMTNGKVDRKSLPAPDAEPSEPRGSCKATDTARGASRGDLGESARC